jgi:hypothetical protein
MRVALLAVIVVGGGAVLAGCASDAGAVAVATGPDTYTMTEKFAPLGFDAEDAERDALFKANQSCVEKGRQLA